MSDTEGKPKKTTRRMLKKQAPEPVIEAPVIAETPKETPKETRRSHFEFVEELPEDSVKIESYLEHKFQNLYYSPSTNEYYQLPRYKYRVIPKKKSYFLCRSDNDKTVKISLKKIQKMLDHSDSKKESTTDDGSKSE